VNATLRRTLQAIAAVAAAGVVTACGGPRGLYWPLFPPDLPPPRVVGEAANGSTVDIVRTQWLLVRLPVERDGVNRWTYDLGKDRILYPSGDTPRSAGPGESDPAPDSTVYTVRAEGTGTTSVRFVYRNPAEPQSPPAKVVAFDVVAR
jgi:hypothetical protein